MLFADHVGGQQGKQAVEYAFCLGHLLTNLCLQHKATTAEPKEGLLHLHVVHASAVSLSGLQSDEAALRWRHLTFNGPAQKFKYRPQTI